MFGYIFRLNDDGPHGRVAPVGFSGAFKNGGGKHNRTNTRSDERAFRKRISKRRAKKGYK